jgi:hypothetical protein
MQRHDLDSVSFLAGMVFVAISLGYALTHLTDLRLRWPVAIPVGMLALGGVVLVLVVRAMRQPIDQDPST